MTVVTETFTTMVLLKSLSKAPRELKRSAAPRAQARAGPLFAMIDLNAARPSEAPTTAGALFIIGPPRAAAAALYDRERISTSVHDSE